METIWVEGYKFTDDKMQGFGGFQFELNTVYKSEISECDRIYTGEAGGFHFICENLDKHISKRALAGPLGRLFKVRAKVNKDQYENKNFSNIVCSIFEPSGVAVAYEIVLYEEVPSDVLIDTVFNIPMFKNYSYIFETPEDKNQLLTNDFHSVIDKIVLKQIKNEYTPNEIYFFAKYFKHDESFLFLKAVSDDPELTRYEKLSLLMNHYAKLGGKS